MHRLRPRLSRFIIKGSPTATHFCVLVVSSTPPYMQSSKVIDNDSTQKCREAQSSSKNR